ncbi:hypothetical protein RFI_34132, partial [Reticulomyxa filosa]
HYYLFQATINKKVNAFNRWMSSRKKFPNLWQIAEELKHYSPSKNKSTHTLTQNFAIVPNLKPINDNRAKQQQKRQKKDMDNDNDDNNKMKDIDKFKITQKLKKQKTSFKFYQQNESEQIQNEIDKEKIKKLENENQQLK